MDKTTLSVMKDLIQLHKLNQQEFSKEKIKNY